MSAYLVQPQQLGIMVSVFGNEAKYADAKSESHYENRIKQLAEWNIESIRSKYDEGKSNDDICQSWLKMTYDNYIAIAMNTFLMVIVDPHGKYKAYTNPVQILKYTHNLEYQSCESHDWRNLDGNRINNWVAKRAADKLDGYDNCQWGFESFPKEIKKDDNIVSIYDMANNKIQ